MTPSNKIDVAFYEVHRAAKALADMPPPALTSPDISRYIIAIDEVNNAIEDLARTIAREASKQSYLKSK